jgi:hypothetical protein
MQGDLLYPKKSPIMPILLAIIGDFDFITSG